MSERKTLEEMINSPEFKKYAKERTKGKKDGWTTDENGNIVYKEPVSFLGPKKKTPKKKAK